MRRMVDFLWVAVDSLASADGFGFDLMLCRGPLLHRKDGKGHHGRAFLPDN